MSTNMTIGADARPRGEPELIVVTRPDAQVQVRGEEVASASGASIDDLQQLLRSEGARMEALFDPEAPEGQAEAMPSDPELAPDGMGAFFQVHAPAERLESLAQQLRDLPAVDAAYVKPPAEPAEVIAPDRDLVLLEPEPSVEAPPSTTPNFSSRQGYTTPAPTGVDVPYAWSFAGGRGSGIRVIDCEWGWQFTHEDLAQNQAIGLVGGTNHSNTDHGTAVMGEIGGDLNTFGVTGIAPDAQLGASSFVGQSTSAAIKKAADALGPGDIILLEVHRRGPNGGGAGQQGFIAIEWWPDDFLAIRYAVNKGIVVVEAAGNGWEDLGDASYDTAAAGFPTWWKNPFRMTNPQSGAVVVGAGSPPSGTHGRTTSPWGLPYVDRARCGFSNWGPRVDAQGWGWEVTTTGYGDLQGGSDRDRWYTDTFSGTSSASPIVVGALACAQGILKAKGMPLMTSARAAQLLRSTGSPQQAAPGRPISQRIGNRPDLRQLVPAALRQWVYGTQVQYTYALTSSQAAWAHLKDLGWRRVQTGAADGVTNVFAMACQAQASGRPVNAYIDDTTLFNLWLP